MRGVLQAFAKRIIENGNKQEKPTLKKSKAAQKPAHKADPKKQSESESIRETPSPSLSKPGGQHERRQKAAEEKVQEILKKAPLPRGRCSEHRYNFHSS